jgi:glycosyltransferase involved in cell wall biosynthesis
MRSVYDSEAPVLSVVIPAYNVEAFIRPAIDSVLSQSFRDLEVIVVDDGSTDSTRERIAVISDPRVRTISKQNGGLPAARNTGIRASRGRYIALLDGDDVWFPGYAMCHVGALDRNPTVGISYSFLAYIDERGQRTGQLLISRLKQPSLRQLVIRNVINSQVVVRRECFSQAGLFDESLRACEDHEMWVRVLHRTHYCARLTPEVLVGYRVRSASLTMNFQHQLKNAHLVADRFVREVGISRRLKLRSLAEDYRIASRKALSDGQQQEAVRLMKAALRHCPWLPLCDLRAMGTLLLIMIESVLPVRARRAPYRTARAVMKLFYRLPVDETKAVSS